MITFTIATCTYNAGNELPPTLQSVLEQDYPYVEHLIIDGASKDNTMSLLEDYKRNNGHSAQGHKINIVSEPDSGLYDAMNKALQQAQGDFILFLNAGDRFHEATTLSKVAASGEDIQRMPAVMYGDTDIVDSQGRFLRHRRLEPPERLTWKSFSQGMLVCHQAFFAKMSLASHCLYRKDKYRFSADFDWCIRLLKEAEQQSLQIVNTHCVVADYLDGGMTTQNHRKSLKERFFIMCYHYGYIKTIWNHLFFLVRAILKK